MSTLPRAAQETISLAQAEQTLSGDAVDALLLGEGEPSDEQYDAVLDQFDADGCRRLEETLWDQGAQVMATTLRVRRLTLGRAEEIAEADALHVDPSAFWDEQFAKLGVDDLPYLSRQKRWFDAATTYEDMPCSRRIRITVRSGLKERRQQWPTVTEGASAYASQRAAREEQEIISAIIESSRRNRRPELRCRLERALRYCIHMLDSSDPLIHEALEISRQSVRKGKAKRALRYSSLGLFLLPRDLHSLRSFPLAEAPQYYPDTYLIDRLEAGDSLAQILADAIVNEVRGERPVLKPLEQADELTADRSQRSSSIEVE